MGKADQDELDLLDQDDFIDDDDEPTDDDDTGSGDDDDKNKDWYLPGRYKTKKQAEKGITKTEQYIKQLEAKLKAKEREVSAPAQQPTPAGDQPQGDEVDQAIAELGIKDDDFITHPVETNKKIMRYIARNMIPTATNSVMQEAGSIKAEIVKEKIKQIYPGFDLDGQEDKVANILRLRFNPAYIRKYPLKAISTVIDELGGKKASKGSRANGTPYSEDPTNDSASTKKARSVGDKIRSGILKAEVGNGNLFD